MTTLREAHTLASAYWDTKGGSTGTIMAMRARKAVELGLGKGGWGRDVLSLTAMDATRVLTGLHSLALSSRSSYYAAFTRMLNLSGKSTHDWPSAGTAPRRVREPMPRDTAEELRQWFVASGMRETADLLSVLWGTGMRVECEALSFDAWSLYGSGLKVKGKGGHERFIPVPAPVDNLMGDTLKMRDMRRLSYGAHLKRWHRGIEAVARSGIAQTKLPTPHAIRHLYATEAYERSGGNLHVVRELLGHADINTTARYIGVDQGKLREAAGA